MLLNLNSLNKSFGTANSWRCSLGNNITINKYIKLVRAVIPNTEYLFETGVNNIIPFSEVGNGYTVIQEAQITPGRYTISTLLTEIGNVMTAESAFAVVYTATYSTLEGKITISGTAAFKLNFDTLTSTSCYYELGYKAILQGGSPSIEASYSPNLSIPNYQLRITGVPDLNTYTSVGNTSFNFIVDLPVNTDGIAYFYEGTTYEQKTVVKTPVEIKNLQIELIRGDSEKQSVITSDWQLTLQYE